MKYKNDQVKIIKEKQKNQFDEYRDIDEEEKEKFINEKLSELTIHQLLKKLDLTDLMMDYDDVSFYPSAMIHKQFTQEQKLVMHTQQI